MAQRVTHSDAQKRYLAALTDPAKGEQRLSWEEAVKKANAKFPKEKFPNVATAQSLINTFKRNAAGAEETWGALLEAGAALRNKEGLSYALIRERLKRKFKTQKVPSSATLSAFCRRKGISDNGADSVPTEGIFDKPIAVAGSARFFRSPKKGKVLVELTREEAVRLLTEAADLEG